jgi:RimJ/RimL family protein N-acetyltransferase
MVGDIEPRGLVAEGDNVAWLGRASRPGEAWVTGLGEDPHAVARLVTQVADAHEVDGVTVPEEVFDALPERLRSPDPGEWCLWTLAPAEAELGPSSAVDLALDDPRIAPLLAHSDSAHLFPGEPRIVRWVGIVEEERLLSVAAQVNEPTGAVHIVSVCTDPQYRGRRLAREACTRIMEGAVTSGAPMLVLEMYVANEAGRAAYGALGFTEVGRYRSGLLAQRHPPRVRA